MRPCIGESRRLPITISLLPDPKYSLEREAGQTTSIYGPCMANLNVGRPSPEKLSLGLSFTRYSSSSLYECVCAWARARRTFGAPSEAAGERLFRSVINCSERKTRKEGEREIFKRAPLAGGVVAERRNRWLRIQHSSVSDIELTLAPSREIRSPSAKNRPEHMGTLERESASPSPPSNVTPISCDGIHFKRLPLSAPSNGGNPIDIFVQRPKKLTEPESRESERARESVLYAT